MVRHSEGFGSEEEHQEIPRHVDAASGASDAVAVAAAAVVAAAVVAAAAAALIHDASYHDTHTS